MKKAIANLGFSDLKVRYFTGRSILISDTGQGKRYQYRNGCMTALGDLEISEWREMITELIAYRSEQELQKQLYEWCAEHTPWLHGKSEITDYALECHAARLFDDPLWTDYIPFNRKYRPNVLDSAELIWAKTACCGTAQQFTVPQYRKICGQSFFCRTCNECTTTFTNGMRMRKKQSFGVHCSTKSSLKRRQQICPQIQAIPSMAKPLLQRESWRITPVTASRCDFWSWAQSPVRPSAKTRTT